MTIRIAIDAMGGDAGIPVTLPAALSALQKHPDLHITLVGQMDLLTSALAQSGAAQTLKDRLELVHAEQVVTMDDLPSKALRNKKQSSMRIAINLLHENQADAMVSAGNTGALMATAKFVLKTLEGVERPAICTSMPHSKGVTYMLDLGANVDVSGENLVQFAVMGSVLVSSTTNNASPKVGLLNVGEEEIKGLPRIKEAHEILRQIPINYVGYAEGNDIFSGKVDVMVCDGFEGNIALKSIEGVAKMISSELKAAMTSSFLTKLGALLVLPALKKFRNRIDPRRYNGASLLGLRKIVIKSHGSADAFSYEHAIEVAIEEVKAQVPERIAQTLQQTLLRNPVNA